MKLAAIILSLFIMSSALASPGSIQATAQQFLYAVKTGEETDSLAEQLSNLTEAAITQELDTDCKKKAFWLNVYNGYVQMLLKKDPLKYKSRNSFFSIKQVKVAGHQLSLDFIEHGILRRSKNKLSMGYFNKLFPSSLEKKWRVDSVDWRIHFALNCGASSCPPIAFYDAAKVDKQLDMATRSYLTGDVEYDSSNNVVKVPKLMSWFRADFGGKDGTRKILQDLQIIPGGSKPAIKYKDYDWTLTLQQYQDL
ncbi:DUF547 domain-containing protein [Aridibaculum aurantiacum]|uniref:DUF547 domain-containing protein n=1 Tax=Aridibaculum aurantiacum TaxID=2810307 RepID=UPI001A9655A2|nr:DUF547 domain-containing protein [Aridibaculum aurantiacum]